MLNCSSAFRNYYNKCHFEDTRSTVHSLHGLYLIALLIQPSSSEGTNGALLSAGVSHSTFQQSHTIIPLTNQLQEAFWTDFFPSKDNVHKAQV